MAADYHTHYHIDAQGLYCPEPVMLLHNAMRQIEVGHVVEIIATDPSTQRDIPKFCQFLGHALLETRLLEKQLFVYRIRKSAAKNN